MNWRPAKETPKPNCQVVIRETGSAMLWGLWTIGPGRGWSKTPKYEWLYVYEVLHAVNKLFEGNPVSVIKVKAKR